MGVRSRRKIRGSFGFGLRDLSGRVGVADGGRVFESEDRGQVQRVGAVGEASFDLTVDA
jgi:hypothetical protein